MGNWKMDRKDFVFICVLSLPYIHMLAAALFFMFVDIKDDCYEVKVSGEVSKHTVD